jgi:hypothetical protein
MALAAVAASALMAASPIAATAGDDPQGSGQPPPIRSNVVIEPVYNGPLFGLEFKFTEIAGRDAYLFGGYAGALFDDRLFVGGAGYWQMDDDCYGYGGYYGGCGYDDYYYDDPYYDYNHGVNGYGGLMVEWYALRSSVVNVSARALVGGGIANIGWEEYYDDYPVVPRPKHGGAYPPAGGYYYYTFDQGYFVFEPQLNITLRIAPGFSLVGGAGYRVIGWANGWEDQLQGFTATAAIRFGGR